MNTSSSNVTIPGSTVPITPGVRVIATGSFTLLNGFKLAGAFTFTAGTQTINNTSQSVVSMFADATLQLRAGTTVVFDLDVNAGLVIFSRWSCGAIDRDSDHWTGRRARSVGNQRHDVHV